MDKDNVFITRRIPRIRLKPEKPETKQEVKSCLIVISGVNLGHVFYLENPRTIIGRTGDIEIKLSSPHVSRMHAEITSSVNGFTISDLDSTNGTFVNSTMLASGQKQTLQDGDRVLIGDVLLKYLCQDDIEAKFHAELYQLASHDGLTGIYNKQYFQQLVSERKNMKPLSIVMFDIDHFKDINDTYGHSAGDLILQELADLVKEAVRGNDVFARYGGEEFIILMNINKDIAISVAQRICMIVNQHKFKFADQVIHCSISIGVAEISEADNIDHLINVADMRLYNAKENGRNQVRY